MNININKIKKINKTQSKFTKDGIFLFVCRQLSFFCTKFFLLINISAVSITYLNLFLGFIIFFLILSSKIMLFKIAIILYFFLNILDCVDGNVARLKNNPTFYGRFIDAFFGIVINSLIIFGSSIFCKNFLENESLYLLGLTSAIIYPFGQFVFDKYSALARWQNSESRKKIKPYIWKQSVSVYFIFFKDLPYLLFFSLLFISNLYLIEVILFLYFILNIFFDTYLIFLHIYKSSKNMNVKAKNHR